jgi:hypothetical protein
MAMGSTDIGRDMTLETKAVSAGELAEIARRLPVQPWNSELAAALYVNVTALVCARARGDIVGLWVIPIDAEGAARRTYRMLPYASPWVDRTLHAEVRHRVAGSLLDAMLGLVSEVELPMDPQFREVAAFLERDVEMVCRHTRVLCVGPGVEWRRRYLSSVRNHMRAAGAQLTVKHSAGDAFAFDRAIKGQDHATVAARTGAGLTLGRSQWPTYCLSAVDGDDLCHGQVFVLKDQHSAILLYSWFDRSGPRGVPSLLVDAAIERSRRDWDTRAFDFEGSVIPSIDRFMAGFGADAVGYAQLRRQESGEESSPRMVLG